MNGTPEEKDKIVHQLLGCNYCHTYQRIMKSKHDAERFMTVIDRMVKGHPINRLAELLPWNWHGQPAKLAA